MSRISEKANCNIEDIDELYRIVNNPDSHRQMVVRAQIILLSNEGWQNKDIAEELGTNANLVGNWIKRYREGGIEALYDLHRSGRAGKNSSIDVFAAIQEKLNSDFRTGNEQWSAATKRRRRGSWRRTKSPRRSIYLHQLPSRSKRCDITYDKHMTNIIQDA